MENCCSDGFLSIFYENMDGIIKLDKMTDLSITTTTSDYDIIAVTETWLDPTIYNQEFISNKYTVFRKDRLQSNIDASKGGGVFIAVKSSFQCEEIITDDMEHLESVCVKFYCRGGKVIYLYCLYIQPTATIDIYRAHVLAIANLVNKIDSTVMIFGDFNLSAVQWQDNDCGYGVIPLIGDSMCQKAIIARETTSALIDLGLTQVCSFRNKWGNVLDLIYTNSPELVSTTVADFRLIPAHKSDPAHSTIMCMLECDDVYSTMDDEMESRYLFHKADYNAIRNYMVTLNLTDLILACHDDVDIMLSTFYVALNDIFEKFVPKKLLKSKSMKRPVWHDKQLYKLKNVRNKLYRKLCDDRANSINVNEQPFLDAKNRFEQHQTQIFSDYVRDLSSKSKHDPKSFWRHVSGKRKTSGLPTRMEYKNEMASTDEGKSNLFAKFFKSVYKEDESDDDWTSFLRSRDDSNCHQIGVNCEIVLKSLRKMDLNKGSGFDGVSSLFMRECAEQLCEPLCVIFTESLECRYYPRSLKIGQVTPIFKSGKRIDVSNYRGVNVLPNIAKLFERIINDQLKLIIFPHIKKTQHGFVPDRNIETNLMELSVRIHEAFEQNAQLDEFYADIGKAFDSVKVKLLIIKLAKFPISNDFLMWIASYLADRMQYVRIGGTNSKLFFVSSGVGQGTVLGPIFFVVFFDDSDPKLDGIFSMNFADDKKMDRIVKNLDDAAMLQTAIDDFMNWCKDNDLEVNNSKCKIISYSWKKEIIEFEYKINGCTIQRVSETNDLGILQDSKSTFNKHFEYVQKKSMAALNFVKRQSKRLDLDATKLLYTSLVRSNLEFACAVWSPYHAIHKNEIESVQRQMVIFLNNDRQRQRDTGNYVLQPYLDRCAKFNLTTLIRRRFNATAMFIYDVLSGRRNSPFLRSLLVINDDSRILRNADLIKLKSRFRTAHSFNSPFNRACRIFNCVSNLIDPTLPRNEFKRMLCNLPDNLLGKWMELT